MLPASTPGRTTRLGRLGSTVRSQSLSVSGNLSRLRGGVVCCTMRCLTHSVKRKASCRFLGYRVARRTLQVAARRLGLAAIGCCGSGAPSAMHGRPRLANRALQRRELRRCNIVVWAATGPARRPPLADCGGQRGDDCQREHKQRERIAARRAAVNAPTALAEHTRLRHVLAGAPLPQPRPPARRGRVAVGSPENEVRILFASRRRALTPVL